MLLNIYWSNIHSVIQIQGEEPRYGAFYAQLHQVISFLKIVQYVKKQFQITPQTCVFFPCKSSHSVTKILSSNSSTSP